MITQENLVAIRMFTEMPQTEKKDNIVRQYMSDEIGPFEFLMQVYEYLNPPKGDEL